MAFERKSDLTEIETETLSIGWQQAYPMHNYTTHPKPKVMHLYSIFILNSRTLSHGLYIGFLAFLIGWDFARARGTCDGKYRASYNDI